MPKAVPKLSVPPPVEAQSDTPATKASTPTIEDVVHDLAADVKLAKREAIRERIQKAFEQARSLGSTAVEEDLIVIEPDKTPQPLAEPMEPAPNQVHPSLRPRSERPPKPAKPQQSLQSLCDPIIKLLEQDLRNIAINDAHHRNTHEIHIPKEFQSAITSLDERCERLYDLALRRLQKNEERTKEEP